ncbi:MAG: superoxide dismutase [Ni] [Pirellulaceae bacterium]
MKLYALVLAAAVCGMMTCEYVMARSAGESSTTLVPHCEVPCGIYTDQLRFERMLEDTKTIAKAATSINDFVNALGDAPPTALDINQSMRWVTTKEDHATNTQHIVAQYFLTQRIKPDNERYVDQLKAAHAVMVAAMKCKQSADPATAEALKNAIFDLYRAYEGKEPNLESHED